MSVGHRFYYFAYGSNLSTRRLQQRAPSATPKCVARLNGYSLAYSKRGKDGSAKCGILERSDASAYVYGVLFAVVNFERQKLDEAEDLNDGYTGTTVSVQTMDGPIEALTYVAQKNYVDVTLKPFEWYREHVLRGASTGFRPIMLPADCRSKRFRTPTASGICNKWRCMTTLPQRGADRPVSSFEAIPKQRVLIGPGAEHQTTGYALLPGIVRCAVVLRSAND